MSTLEKTNSSISEVYTVLTQARQQIEKAQAALALKNGENPWAEFERVRSASESGFMLTRGGQEQAATASNEKPALPPAAYLKAMINLRKARGKFFDQTLFNDPAWNMVLDLALSHAEGRQVSVSSLCFAANIPTTTALRWIQQMVDLGILERHADQVDKRRVFVSLTQSAMINLANYFAEVRKSGLPAI